MAQNGSFSITSNDTLADFFIAIKDELLEVTDWTVKEQSTYSVSFNVDSLGDYLTFSDDNAITDDTQTSRQLNVYLYSSDDVLKAKYGLMYSSGSYTPVQNTTRKIAFFHASTKSGTYIYFAGYNSAPASMPFNSTNNPAFGFDVPIIDLNGNKSIGLLYELVYLTPTTNYDVFTNGALSNVNTTNYLAIQRRYLKITGGISGYIDGSYVSSTVSSNLKYSFGGKSYISLTNYLLAEV